MENDEPINNKKNVSADEDLSKNLNYCNVLHSSLVVPLYHGSAHTKGENSRVSSTNKNNDWDTISIVQLPSNKPVLLNQLCSKQLTMSTPKALNISNARNYRRHSFYTVSITSNTNNS